jgi:methylmalonyl-CoA mutase C-terminal domain/subunit
MQLLKEKDMTDVLVIVGGIIPDADKAQLQAVGISGVFQPGTRMQDIIDFINQHVRPPVQ